MTRRFGSLLGLMVGFCLLAAADQAEAQRRFRDLRIQQNTLRNPREFQGRLGSDSFSRFRADAYRLRRQQRRAPGRIFNLPGSQFRSIPRPRLPRGAGGYGTSGRINAGLLPRSGSSRGINYGIRSAPSADRFAAWRGGQILTDEGIILPRIEELDQYGYYDSSLQAFEPVQGDKLGRVSTPSVKAAAAAGGEPSFSTGSEQDRQWSELFANKTKIYTTRQLSAARTYLRDRRFSQAVAAYRAALELDPKNVQARIGVVYALIACRRYQAAGLNIVRLYKDDPAFWKSRCNLRGCLGGSYPQLLEDSRSLVALLDQYINTHDYERPSGPNEYMLMGNLCKAYLAWLKGDESGILDALRNAAAASPFHAQVQQMYRRFAGLEAEPAQQPLQIKPLG